MAFAASKGFVKKWYHVGWIFEKAKAYQAEQSLFFAEEMVMPQLQNVRHWLLSVRDEVRSGKRNCPFGCHGNVQKKSSIS